MPDDLYNRQETLELSVPESAGIIGVGGVGSWVALDLALMGVNKLVLVDYDIVERNNRNRSLFTTAQEGEPKVEALAQLCYERREVDIYPLAKKFESLSHDEYELLKSCEIIVDCRDTSDFLDGDIAKKNIIIGGYNGSSITIHINPSPDSVFGEGGGYTITPSWLVPPQLIACVICAYIGLQDVRKEHESIKTFNLEDMIEWVVKKERDVVSTI